MFEIFNDSKVASLNNDSCKYYYIFVSVLVAYSLFAYLTESYGNISLKRFF